MGSAKKGVAQSVKMSTFKRDALKIIAGQTDGEVIDEIQEDATNAIQGQIHALKGTLTLKKKAVVKAKESFTSATVNNGKAIDGETDKYMRNLDEARKEIKKAQEVLENTEELIAFFEKLLKDFDVEVEGEVTV